MGTATQHRWTFFRSGGFDQARLDSAADLADLENLDQKLWAALACPVKGLEFDERTLALIDTDLDGRVRAPEVIAAVQWCEDHMRDLAALKAGSDRVPLAQINDQTANGKAILASAKRLLTTLGKADAQEISLADVNDLAKAFAATNFNGDGIVPADAASDPAVKKVVEEMIAAVGAVADRSTKPGVDQAKVDAFFAQLTAFDDWTKKGEDAAILPLGAATAAAADAWSAVRAKVDDYFARCRLAAFDARALAAVNRNAEEYLALSVADMSASNAEVKGFPLAQIAPAKPLDLVNGLNPAWAGAVAALKSAAIVPLLGAEKATLTESEWAAVSGKLAGFVAWRDSKTATAVEALGTARVREILTSGAKTSIEKLIAEDKALETEFAEIAQVERLVRYARDLFRLLCNFVNFSDFYSPDRLAIFQAGTLYLDQRACELCVLVADGGKHAALAGMSKCYLAYCDCTRPGGQKITIAAAFTGGDSDYLMAGRNGIFYDRKGRDWDATITKVIENPISIRQAFWAPYKKLVRLVEEQVAKRAAAAEAESDAKIAAAAAAAANADKTVAAQPAAAAKPEPKKIDVGTVAALGVAFGAIGTLLATIVGYAFNVVDLPFWQVCLALVGLLLLISGPSMLIAWLKLRQRNMGPILDANGWAVNGRVKMNVPFGGSLTAVAELPPGALPAAADPFGERRSPWPGIIKTVVVLGFAGSVLNHYALGYMGLSAAGLRDLPPFVRKPESLKSDVLAAVATRDGNADKKVVRTEFDGDDKAFERLDTNADGCISAIDAHDSFDEEKATEAEEKK